jgi:hypothetical protein
VKPEVRKELDDLLKVVSNWIDCEVANADCDGRDHFLLDDFIEDISYQVLPYVRRFVQLGHITNEQYGEFLLELKAKADELRKRLRLPEDPEGTQ